jgi:hypothetical protein
MQRSAAIPRSNWLKRGTLTIALVVTCLVAAACDGATSSPRPSPSLVDVVFTPQPTPTTEGSAGNSSEPTFLSLPVGWDDDFCAVFADVFVSQELVIDVERALEEENLRDARLLARELRDTSSRGSELLTDLADWDSGHQVMLEMATLLDLGSRAGDEYGMFFADDSTPALRRARGLRKEIGTKTPQANAALAELATLGISCPDHDLVLESP